MARCGQSVAYKELNETAGLQLVGSFQRRVRINSHLCKAHSQALPRDQPGARGRQQPLDGPGLRELPWPLAAQQRAQDVDWMADLPDGFREGRLRGRRGRPAQADREWRDQDDAAGQAAEERRSAMNLASPWP